MTSLTIKTCPTCGSKRIRRVKRNVPSKRGSQPFIAHGITVEACPNCGEVLFSPESLEAIDAQRPPARKSPRNRKSA
jgi:YgiT-type zinc finger domain-containing protein